jgi:hypothetical protein
LDYSVTNLATARRGLAGAGTANSSFSFWWSTGSSTAATEEYNNYGEPNTFENIGQVWYNGTTKELKFTDETFSSAWATGGNIYEYSRKLLAGAGTQTAGLAFGGLVPPNTGETEEYDGLLGHLILLV